MNPFLGDSRLCQVESGGTALGLTWGTALGLEWGAALGLEWRHSIGAGVGAQHLGLEWWQQVLLHSTRIGSHHLHDVQKSCKTPVPKDPMSSSAFQGFAWT